MATDRCASPALTASDLHGMRGSQLRELLCSGYPIEPEELDDTEYRGVSLNLPRALDRVLWKTFKKVFHRDPVDGTLRGWNVRIEQTGTQPPFRPLRKGAGLATWGHYRVVPARDRAMPVHCPQALLLDYGHGMNGWRPEAAVRDPLVAVNAGSVSLLLGWSYLEVGPLRIGTPSFFSLERDGPLTHVAVPPGRRSRS